MSEHSGRYARLAEALLEDDLAVYALDHRGFGRTSAVTGMGKTGPGGFDGVLDSIRALQEQAVADLGDVPAGDLRPLDGVDVHPVLHRAVPGSRRGDPVGHHRTERGTRGHGRRDEGARRGRCRRRTARCARRVQRSVRTCEDGLRLAQPRRGRGRCLHRRPDVRRRQPGHRGLRRRPARQSHVAGAARGRGDRSRPTFRCCCSPARPTRSPTGR